MISSAAIKIEIIKFDQKIYVLITVSIKNIYFILSNLNIIRIQQCNFTIFRFRSRFCDKTVAQ